VLDGGISDKAAFLNTLENKLGRILCLVRCNLSDRAAVAQWNRPGITPVSEDADAAGLVGILQRTERLRDWMADPAIKKLLPLVRKLPTAPELHRRVTEELQSANGSMIVVAGLISQDPVMSAKILQVVNSAFFGMGHEVSDTADAAMALGAERIRSLILLAGVFSQYDCSKCPGFSPEPVWGHSVQVGILARSIAFAETKNVRTAEAAFTAGLLHDIGKLVLAGNLPDMYGNVRRLQASKNILEREAELMVLGITHAQLGACLLASWGLPLPILEAIAWHHEPERSTATGFSLLAAVHVANVFVQENDAGGAQDRIRVEYLLKAGLGNCGSRWREICGLPPRADEETSAERHLRRREAKEN